MRKRKRRKRKRMQFHHSLLHLIALFLSVIEYWKLILQSFTKVTVSTNSGGVPDMTSSNCFHSIVTIILFLKQLSQPIGVHVDSYKSTSQWLHSTQCLSRSDCHVIEI